MPSTKIESFFISISLGLTLFFASSLKLNIR